MMGFSKKALSILLVIFLVIDTPMVESFNGRQFSKRPAVDFLRSRKSQRLSFGAKPLSYSLEKDVDRLGQRNIIVNGDTPHRKSPSHGELHSESQITVAQQDAVHDHITTKDKTIITVTTVAAALGFVGLLKATGPEGWRYFLAGGICAATSHAITNPIDVVKTRKQVDPELTNQSFGKATLAIVKNDGMNALLAGLGPTTIGYLLEGAIKFGIYEILKPVSGRFMATLARVTTLAFLDSSVLGFVMCGVVSGIAASVVLCPMEALRIRLVAEPDFAPDGWIQGGYKMLKNEGVNAVWKGMTPMLYKQVPYTVAKNVSFDVFTKLAYSILLTSGRTLTGSMKMIVPLLSAVFASMISCISSQPGDMLLSLVNAHEGPKRTNDFLKEILESEQGARRLFVGIKSRFLHVGVIVTVQLMLYDLIKRLCGIAATGTI